MVDNNVQVTEKLGSGSTSLDNSDPTSEKIYSVVGTSSDTLVTNKIKETSPVSYRGLRRSSIEAKPVDHEVWEVVVTYTLNEQMRYVTDVSWTTTGATQKIFRSKATESVFDFGYNPWQSAPDFQGAINVTQDAVEGVDVTIPVLSFTETHKYDPSDVTDDLIAGFMQKTGTVNALKFRGFNPGEVLFLGVSGQTDPDVVGLSFEFSVSRNFTWIHNEVAHTIQGWNYLWYFFMPQVDLSTGIGFQVPMAGYEERVYDYVNFGTFVPDRVGIPTNPLPASDGPGDEQPAEGSA